MTICNRCGNEFDNCFNGVHWCIYCGKQFALDTNQFKKKNMNKKEYNETLQKEMLKKASQK